MGMIGSLFAVLSPINIVFATLAPVNTLPAVLNDGLLSANVTLGIASIVSGTIWLFVSFGLLRSMSSSFVVTVRRLAGIN